jgi:hypothetical protein
VVLRPEWATVEAIDKHFTAALNNHARGSGAVADYLVPPGKTLRLTNASVYEEAAANANLDLMQITGLVVVDGTTGATLWYHGGNGGVGATFSTPLVIPAGHRVVIEAVSGANHNVNTVVVAGGYEL